MAGSATEIWGKEGWVVGHEALIQFTESKAWLCSQG